MNFNITYNENDVVKGIVTKIKNYGAFLSFEAGYVGLLHISEISELYVSSIYSYFKVGDQIEVLIKEVDRNTKFLKVSIKALPDKLNKFKGLVESKKVMGYINNIDFTKLSKQLPGMVKDEIERIKSYGN